MAKYTKRISFTKNGDGAAIGFHTATVVLGSLFIMLNSSAVNAEPSIALDRLSVSAGGFYVNPTFNARANTQYGSAETGDISRNRTTLPRVRAEVLLGDSQGLSFDYFRYRNDYTYDNNRVLNVGGIPANLSATANANIGFDFASLAYKWWLGKDNDVFGVGVGAGYYRAHFDVVANGVFNGTSGSLDESRTEKTFAPLLEAGWKHAFSKDLRLVAEASGVRKNWGSTTGHVYNAALGLEWYPLKNLGIGADYGTTRIHLAHASNDANLDVKLTGPSAYVKLRY